ncbi:hypothetical protein BOTBODRAFT_30748 [Botryobasidium botryosum FD-172 SS1]|uniref:RRM domain-containing protein n=1 Tax=Botryobasidium botryosum (strain FD-172 SS1) TaxID=930990 RepID=A0A067MQ97_BOTB1|nr:hypothetical protein BOTBODRAFT_30748 [Botryobasidium botryosum FD-172 SS1]
MGTKRKERTDAEEEAGATGHGSTIFISNLAYSTTSDALQSTFSDIAPVRSAFVVTDKEDGKSKGVGYVAFAIKEDAESFMKTYSHEGEDAEGKPFSVDGRKVRIKWADKKAAPGTAPTTAPMSKKPRPAFIPIKAPHDPNAIRTLVVANLPSDLTKAALWKKVRKQDGAESVEWPINDDNSTAHVLFTTPALALAAVPKLHNHVFKGALLSAVLKKRADNLSKTSKTSGPNRGNRLIIRNLPWNISEADLRAIFTPYGPLHSVHLPVSESTDSGKPPLARGFAFVWFLSKADAEKALEAVHGTKVVGGVSSRPQTTKKGKKSAEKEGDGSAGGAKDEGRIVAVDWALSKERWEQVAGEAADEESEGSEGEEDEEKDGESSEGDSDGDSEDEEQEQTLGVNELSSGSEESDSGSSGSEQSDDDDDESMASPSKSSRPPAPEEGTTLFIRNVPFEATDEDLGELFRSFGPIRYARVTMDKGTGRSRGTGFVCFWKVADADHAVEESDKIKAQAGLEKPATRANPFTLLTPDPSSTLTARLVLQGRTLDVTRAVTREEADKLKDAGERKRERKDARNLYLMREGVIFPSTPAASTISLDELERRNQAFNARRKLLQTNPSLYISRTRLSVRQLPTFVTERGLKRLAMYAIREFDAEVAKGMRAALSPDELERQEGEEKPRPKKGERLTGVRQAKIVRQAEKVDPVTGKGKSRGYGFLQLDGHAEALRVLRWANNNSDLGGLLYKWWKEELEDLVKGKQSGKGSGSKDAADAAAYEAQRVKRTKEKLLEVNGLMEKGATKVKPLLLEFSIENVNVVKRRSEKVSEGKDGAPKLRSKRKNEGQEPEGDDKRRGKRARPARPSNKAEGTPEKRPKATGDPKDKKESKGSNVGRIIGKKRKERRGKA